MVEYVQLDNGFKREDSVRDIGALLDWMKTSPISIRTGSPFTAAATAATWCRQHGALRDRLAAGVDIVGISNFVTSSKIPRTTGVICDGWNMVMSVIPRCAP